MYFLHNFVFDGPFSTRFIHAPQAPYLGPWAGSTMGYTGMIRDDPYIKKNLDFLNIQFYNQGAGLYDSYEGLKCVYKISKINKKTCFFSKN